jgi:hypothetical protein
VHPRPGGRSNQPGHPPRTSCNRHDLPGERSLARHRNVPPASRERPTLPLVGPICRRVIPPRTTDRGGEPLCARLVAAVWIDDERMHLTVGTMPSVHIRFGISNVEQASVSKQDSPVRQVPTGTGLVSERPVDLRSPGVTEPIVDPGEGARAAELFLAPSRAIDR